MPSIPGIRAAVKEQKRSHAKGLDGELQHRLQAVELRSVAMDDHAARKKLYALRDLRRLGIEHMQLAVARIGNMRKLRPEIGENKLPRAAGLPVDDFGNLRPAGLVPLEGEPLHPRYFLEMIVGLRLQVRAVVRDAELDSRHEAEVGELMAADGAYLAVDLVREAHRPRADRRGRAVRWPRRRRERPVMWFGTRRAGTSHAEFLPSSPSMHRVHRLAAEGEIQRDRWILFPEVERPGLPARRPRHKNFQAVRRLSRK